MVEVDGHFFWVLQDLLWNTSNNFTTRSGCIHHFLRNALPRQQNCRSSALRRQLQQALASGFIPDAPLASHTTDNRSLAEDSLPLPLKKRNWGTRHDKTAFPLGRRTFARGYVEIASLGL
jgi:hypothetical protein